MTGDLHDHLHAFFEVYLRRQRGVSINTIRSYRDTFKLLVAFIGARYPGRALRFKNVDAKTVLAFLEHLEDPDGGRGSSPRTRNQRLAAIQSFFKYLTLHGLGMGAHAERVLAVPAKRVSKRDSEFLTYQELEVLFAQPQTLTTDGIRDLAILVFLYNTGARASEAANARISWFDFPNRTVKITGKGNKERINPLWPTTVKLLELYRAHHRRKPKPSASDRFFINQRGLSFTRFGMRSVVKKYLCLAARSCPSIAGKRLSTHNMRHTLVCHLLESKVDVNAIKTIMGHSSIKSLDDYAHTSLAHMRRIYEQFGPPPIIERVLDPKPEGAPDQLLSWLDRLAK
jgi:site-specific recombinase XerD